MILANNSNPRVLFKVLDSLTNPPPSYFSDASQDTCEKFLTHFLNKVKKIRHQITHPEYPVLLSREALCNFSSFEPVSLSFLSDILAHMKPATCSLDFIPSRFLKEVFNTVGPSILSIINSSLSEGVFPSAFKHAVVQPLLKKPNLDPTDFNNFRPISKLPFFIQTLREGGFYTAFKFYV